MKKSFRVYVNVKGKRRFLYVILLIFFLSIILASVVGISVSAYKAHKNRTVSDSYEPYEPKPLDQDVLWRIVQEWRVSEGYEPYMVSDDLCRIANERLGALYYDFSHTGFITNTDVFRSTKYGGFTTLGENLIMGFPTEETCLNSWLASPKHRENLIMNYSHSCIRCGVHDERNYCIQVFGSHM